jgi:hypothetical protein
MHSNFLLHALQFGVEKCALQFFWSGKLSTPICLEWTPFHSKIFHFLGVNNHALKAHSKNLKCTSSPLQKFWSAPKVHSKKIGVHNIPLQKCQNFGVHNCPLQFFWSGRLFTPFFFWSGHLPTPKCWSTCSKSLECI